MSDLEQKLKQQNDEELSYTSIRSELPFTKVELDLGRDVGIINPERVGPTFKSVWVESATDSNCKANLALGKRSLANLQDALPLSLNQHQDFGLLHGDAYLWWEKQPGKKMTLVFARDAKITPGSTIQKTSGGVAISVGETVDSQPAKVTITGSIGTLLAADANRKQAIAHNFGPDRGYYGGGGLTIESGANPGTPIEVGETIQIDTQGELKSISEGTSVFSITIFR